LSVPLFRYKAATTSGDIVEGEREASSQASLIKWIQAQGHVALRADPIAEKSIRSAWSFEGWRRGRITTRDLGMFTLELSTLLKAGLALDKALDILAKLSETKGARALCTSIRERVRGGGSLSEAMADEEAVFSPFYLNMVRAGETGGALDLALERLGDFMQRSRELKETITSALIYPLILVFVAILSLAVILGYVVPRFTQLFEDAGQALPWSTQIVVAMGEFVQNYWWVLIAAVVGGYLLLLKQFQDPVSRLRWDTRLLALPLVGELVSKIETARFSRTLGTLLANGLPLHSAIVIAKETVGNRLMSQHLQSVSEKVRAGQGLSKPLIEANVFPTLAAELMRVGEETGNLEAMLQQLTEIYEREVKTLVQRLVTLLEPALILGLGLLIAGIIMSILAAVLSVTELGI
jgi:general secretion pathway protein F